MGGVVPVMVCVGGVQLIPTPSRALSAFATAFESDDGFFSFSYVRIMYTAFSEVCPPKSAAFSGSMNVTARFTVSESTVAGGNVASSTGLDGALAAELALVAAITGVTSQYTCTVGVCFSG